MRSTNSLKNAIVALIMNIINIVIGFIAQKVFIVTLGDVCLGINGLFNNIISMLGVVELGFGSAIICNLYKPIAEDDKPKIKTLMNFYKKSYRLIAFVVFIIGLLVLPFINNIVGDVVFQYNIYFIFMLYLIDVVCSYLLTYKRSILYASQKAYVINIVHIVYTLVMNGLQILFLFLAHNFVIYLVIKIACRIVENVAINIVVNKRYTYLREKNVEKIEEDTKNDIIKKIKGLIFHKIGGFFVLGTDNIIISVMPKLGVIMVGLYSNYNMIITAVNTLLSQIFSSIVASVGNLLVENDREKSYAVYKKMLLLNSWLFAFAGTCILCLMQPFIELVFGTRYVLDFAVLIVLVINFYVQGMRKTCSTFKEAAGIFHEDRFAPIFESFLNIIFSVLFAYWFGLAGVFMGTIVSSFALFFFSYPKFVYKPLFKKSYKQYFKEYFVYLIITVIAVAPTYMITNVCTVSNLFLQLVINSIICLIIPNVVYYIIMRNSEEFHYYKELLINTVRKISRGRV